MTSLKPVFIFGNGLRNNPELIKSLCKLGVPVLTTWQGIDLVSEDNPVFCGRPGVIGQRAANIIIQKCNWLTILGARLDMETLGHSLENFAPQAQKTVVDVDLAELEKYQPIPSHPPTWECFQMDLDILDRLPINIDIVNDEWLGKCKTLYNGLRWELDGTNSGDFVEPYSFIRELSNISIEKDVFVPGSSGVQSCAFMQAFKVKPGQRILLCNTIGAMGMEAMAIGAALASGRRVIVVTGDGGFAQSMTELEVASRLNLPIHYFVFCNGGYGSISTMQDNRFGLQVGSTRESGLTLPDLKTAARMFGLQYFEMKDNNDLPMIGKIIENKRATITSVNTSLGFRYATKTESTIRDGIFIPDDLADMTPKMNWKELL